MPPFPTCKITVLKTLNHQDLAEEYRRPDVRKGPCHFFKVGDEFTVNYLAERPEGFDCDWSPPLPLFGDASRLSGVLAFE